MRNLKRALSLLLSSTMVLGMVVMGGSAAGYQDVDASNDNQEAIEVLKAVGIMTGDENGNFNPNGGITRNEMAVVMAHLLNLDYDYYRGTNPFTDVPDWAAPYVAACAAEGVVAGIGNGQYGGNNAVTAAQASLMIMKALGYFQNQEDFGDDWQIATIRQASYIDLFNRINATAESALTRGQVAQLVLNGLKSDMVSFTGDKGVQIGDVTVGYHAEYTPKSSTAAKYNSIVGGKTDIAQQGQYYIQLGEELYNGKLKLANGSDDFQRPSRVWSYDGKEIGTYAKKELIVETYTAGVTGKDMYNLLSSATINDYDLANYVDGAAGTIKKSDLVRSNNDSLDNTGNGVVTEVYVDNQAKEITIVSINNYLAKATSNYSKEKEYAPLNVYVKDTNGLNYNVDVEEVAAVANVTKDTFYRVNISYKNNSTVGEVVAISDVKVLTDSTVTKFSTSSGWVSKLTVDSTEYKANKKAFYDANVLNTYNDGLLTNNTYNVYVDANGYFLGVDLYSGESNYVFITGYDLSGSHIAVKTAEAAAIFLDGTMKNIKVNIADTNKNITAATGNNAAYFDEWKSGIDSNEINEWYTYTVDADGVYTLKPATRMTWTDYPDNSAQVIRTDNLSIVDTQGNHDRVYGEDATVFLTVDTNDVSSGTTLRGITEVTGVYTGVQSVDIEIDTSSADAQRMGQIFTVYDKDWYVIGAVVIGEAVGGNENLAYILGSAKSEKYEGGTYYWEFDAFMGDSIKTFTAKSKYPSSTVLKPGTVQELRFDGNYVVNIKDLDANKLYTNNTVAIDGQSVYQMTNLHAFVSDVIANGPETTLNLQGRTFYLTAGRTDVGLALASNAKAVVIQDENQKTNVKTEFDSVAAAISHLADPDNNTANGLQYKGNIYAALDSNGVAKWIVFDSDTALTTGSTVTPPSGSGYTPVVTQRGNFLDVKANTNTGTDMDVYIGAWNWLVNNGYSVVSANIVGSNWQFLATKNGNSYFFNTNLITMVKLDVNGVETYVQNGTNMTVAGEYYYLHSAAPASYPIVDGGSDHVEAKATSATINWAQNGYYYVDGLYKYTIGGSSYYDKAGAAITLTGSYYSIDGGATYTAIPSGGLKMSAALDGKTIAAAWKVVVTASANGGTAFEEYVADNGTTATATGLAVSTTYRTDDGKFVTTDGSKKFANVKHDITISSNTVYYSVSMPVAGNNGKGLGYTIKNAGETMYLKSGDTFTLEVVLSGTSSDTTAITFTASNATTVASDGPVTPSVGATTGSAAISSSGTVLTITPAANVMVSGLTYSVTFTVGTGNVTFS